jgi:hypothetical protein
MLPWLLPRARGLALSCAFPSPLLAPARAGAQGPPGEVVVVEVPGAPADAAALRSAIGAELGADAVPPTDPRAASARGTLVVGVDAHRLTVSYRTRSEPVERTVDLPGDPAAALRAVVVLAGNLARDEGTELAAELRHAQPASPAPAPAGSARKAEEMARDDEAQLEAIRLQATLDYYARQDRSGRLAASWTALGLGAVGIGTGLAITNVNRYTTPYDPTGALILTVGGALAVDSLIGFTTSSRLEDLAAYNRHGGGETSTEEAWVRAASSEHSRRHTLGILNVILGSAAIGFGARRASPPRAPTSRAAPDPRPEDNLATRKASSTASPTACTS